MKRLFSVIIVLLMNNNFNRNHFRNKHILKILIHSKAMICIDFS